MSQSEDAISAVGGEVKVVVVVRTKYPDGKGGTLKPRAGKIVGQAIHAFKAIFTSKMNEYYCISGDVVNDFERAWIDDGLSRVIVCKVDTLDELLSVQSKALEAGVYCNMQTDAGLTEFRGEKMVTCLALGPALSSDLDRITGHLQLF